MAADEINLGGNDEGMERRQDEAITVVVEVAGVLDAGGVKDGHRILLDTAVRGGGGGGGRRARDRHSADAEVWEGFSEVVFFFLVILSVCIA